MMAQLSRPRPFARLATVTAALAIAIHIAVAPAVAESIEEADEIVAAMPAQEDEQVTDQFLMSLLDAINERRDDAGTQRLSFVPAHANAALDRFLAETVTRLTWPGPCRHVLIEGAFSWDYVVAAGFGGDPRGEVLACPGPEPYWTPDRTAAQWWDSPVHHGVLYSDGDSNAIACSAHGVRNRRSHESATAVLCVTFRS